MVERRKLAKKTRLQLQRSDAEFFDEKQATFHAGRAERARTMRTSGKPFSQRGLTCVGRPSRWSEKPYSGSAARRRLFLDQRLAGRIEIKSYSSPSRRATRRRTARPSGTCCCTARRVPVSLVAKRLAKASGLEYALMSGGDVGPLGGWRHGPPHII